MTLRTIHYVRPVNYDIYGNEITSNNSDSASKKRDVVSKTLSRKSSDHYLPLYCRIRILRLRWDCSKEDPKNPKHEKKDPKDSKYEKRVPSTWAQGKVRGMDRKTLIKDTVESVKMSAQNPKEKRTISDINSLRLEIAENLKRSTDTEPKVAVSFPKFPNGIHQKAKRQPSPKPFDTLELPGWKPVRNFRWNNNHLVSPQVTEISQQPSYAPSGSQSKKGEKDGGKHGKKHGEKHGHHNHDKRDWPCPFPFRIGIDIGGIKDP
ncbi:hypothetical protein ABW20_dc0102252 [Dactylellina cionopaga]|nr:hypothetical protein ABW20_dc0102252 [Dactylellina cionopaga]